MAQNNQVVRSIKAIDVPEYAGDPSLDKLQARAWAQRIDQLRDIANQGIENAENHRWTDGATAQYASMALKGKAGQWYNILVERGQAPAGWAGNEGLKKIFLDRFHHKATLAEESAIEDALIQEDKEPVRDFFDRVQAGVLTIMESYTELTIAAGVLAAAQAAPIIQTARRNAYEFFVRRKFIHGLQKAIKAQVVVQNPETLQDMVDLAVRVEASFSNERKAKLPLPEVSAISSKEAKSDQQAKTENPEGATSLDQFVDLVKARLNKPNNGSANRGARQRQGNRGNRGGGRGGAARSSGQGAAALVCFYCDRPYHTEANCYAKKRDAQNGVYNPAPGSRRAQSNAVSTPNTQQVHQVNQPYSADDIYHVLGSLNL